MDDVHFSMLIGSNSMPYESKVCLLCAPPSGRSLMPRTLGGPPLGPPGRPLALLLLSVWEFPRLLCCPSASSEKSVAKLHARRVIIFL